MSVAENCWVYMASSLYSSFHQQLQPSRPKYSLIPGFVKDSEGTIEGVTLQRHWKVLSLSKNRTVLLLTFRRFHFEC